MNLFKVFVILIIIMFLSLFFIYSNGYSEKILQDKISLTNEKIEEFENDILNQENILINNYLEEEIDYSTKTSKVSLKISNKIEKIVNSSIKFIFKKLGNMIE